MILIQTAMEFEYRAVVASFRPSPQTQAAVPPITRQAAVASGFIANQFCCVIRTGMGRDKARRGIEQALATCDRPTLVVSLGTAGALTDVLPIGAIRVISDVRLDADMPSPMAAAIERINARWIGSVGLAPL